MKTVKIIVGGQGSGKSTYVRKILKKKDFAEVSENGFSEDKSNYFKAVLVIDDFVGSGRSIRELINFAEQPQSIKLRKPYSGLTKREYKPDLIIVTQKIGVALLITEALYKLVKIKIINVE